MGRRTALRDVPGPGEVVKRDRAVVLGGGTRCTLVHVKMATRSSAANSLATRQHRTAQHVQVVIRDESRRGTEHCGWLWVNEVYVGVNVNGVHGAVHALFLQRAFVTQIGART